MQKTIQSATGLGIAPGRTKTTADYLRDRNNPPAPYLKAGVIYGGDNGRLICVHCAGYSAKYSGHDLSGHRVSIVEQAEADQWMRVFGEEMECEGGCTKHKATAGVGYSKDAAIEIFGMEVA